MRYGGAQQLKIAAAERACDFISNGMRLGIGTGSTAEEFIRRLSVRVMRGLAIVGVPTSKRSAALCCELGVPVAAIDEISELDLTIDGADEIGPGLTLIKGGGGALLYEKIIASSSKDMLVIADYGKVVEILGAFPLPIEVNTFGFKVTKRTVEKVADTLGLTGTINLRMEDDIPFLTDGGHFILDASFGCIADPQELSNSLLAIPGVVEHGLFLQLASRAVIACESDVKIMDAKSLPERWLCCSKQHDFQIL